MPKRFITFLLLSVLLTPITMQAEEITIGNGTDPSYFTPFNTYYEYSWNQTIYPSSSLSGECNITSVAYDCEQAVTSPLTLDTLRIYMGVTELEHHNGEEVQWLQESELTLVYEGVGVQIGDAAGWKTFQLDNAYTYPGEGNLVVVVAKRASAYNQNVKFRTTASSLAGLYRESFASAAYFHHPAGAAGSYLNCYANIKMEVETSGSTNNQIVIGGETTASYFTPFNTYHEYSWNQTIYPGSSFSGECNITSVAYDCEQVVSAPLTLDTLRIYMGITELENHIGEGGTQWLTESELTLVYEGVGVTIGDATGWKSFQLDNAYTYPGEGNLVVVVAKTASAYNQNVKFRTSASPFATLYRESFASASYFNHPGGEQGSYLNYYANIKMEVEPTSNEGEIVIIGTETAPSYYAPFNNNYEYSWNQSIYPGTAFTGACNITSVAYDCVEAVPSPIPVDTIRIYMSTTANAVHNELTDWLPESELTLVYEGTNEVLGDQAGWKTFQLDNAFSYPGEGNLIIVVAKSSTAFNPNVKFKTTFSMGAGLYREYWETPYFYHPGNAQGSILNCYANIQMNVIYSETPIVTTGTVNGTVTIGGSPLAGVNVAFEGINGTTNSYNFTTAENGTYSGTLNAGTYTATASLEGYETIQYANNVVITAGQNTTGIDFVMEAIATLDVMAEELDANNVKIQWTMDLVGNAINTFQHFNVYRTSCDDTTGENAIPIASQITEVEYIDNTWGVTEPGNYKWGVSYVYGAPRHESNIQWNEKTNRTTTGYALVLYPYEDCGYTEFDLETATVTNKINTAAGFAAGEYYDGIYYVAKSYIPQHMAKLNPETGEEITSVATGLDLRVLEMAYDYTTHTMYAYMANSYGSINKLGTVNLETLAVTESVDLGSTALKGLFCATNGQLYGMTKGYGSTLVSIDKTTGECTTIGAATELNPAYSSSAAFDHNTGIAYFASGEYSGDKLFTINLETGEPTEVGSFKQVVGLYIPYTPATGGESDIVMSNCLEKTNINTFIENLYVSPTGFAMWDGDSITPTPSGDTEFFFDFEDGMQGWTTIDADSDGNNFTLISELSGSVGYDNSTDGLSSASFINYVGPLTPNNYAIAPQKYAITNTSTLSFYACGQDSEWAAEHFGVAISTTGNTSEADFTTIQEWTLTAKDIRHDGPRGTRDQGNWYNYSVDLSAYAGQEVWIAFRHFNCTDMYMLNIDNVQLSTAKANREGEVIAYKVLLDGNEEAEVLTPYYQHDVTNLVEGETYTTSVAEVYADGISAYTSYEWTYVSCSNYEGANLTATADGSDVVLSWTIGGNPANSEFYFDFEDGIQGWTKIDADGDGYVFGLMSDYNGDTGHNGSADALCSMSYINTLGPLTPDNYVITPQKYTITSGSNLNFWACGQDSGWAAEHIGVAISTTDNANASAFTTIWEQTLTAKGERHEGPRGTREQGTWYEFNVDLSTYAGQEVWIAFRHFNCTDKYMVNIDDVTLSNGQSKGREVITYNFDNGMQGWTTIDADGDGYNFTMLSQLEGTPGHNGSADAICSQSYIPFYGPLTPDNYIVSPNKYLIDENSSVNFFACGEDGAFPSEHFGLAISSGSNTDPNDFTTIADWTLTGKAQGTWHEFTVSLAEYAGQELYIAFRHYDITNWYIMDIDDVTITSAGSIAPVPHAIGAIVYRNGEYLAYTEENEYTDVNLDEGEYEYCVKVVYSNYAMACESCEIVNVTANTCDAPENLNGEYAWNTASEFGAMISWGEQVVPVESWMFYDDGANVDAIGLAQGGSFYWGIMIPSSLLQPYAGTSLTKVAYFDYAAHTGKVMIYQGGATAPGTLVHQQNYTANGTAQYVEWELTSAIPVDVTQNLWIVMNNNDGQYVAACGNDTGDANGRWISIDGTDWMDVTAAGIQATWNLRGFVTNTRTGELVPVEAPALNGTPGATLVNAGVSRQGDVVMDFTARDLALVSYKVYRSTSNDNYELIATVPAVEGQDYYEYFDDIDAGTYYYQVTAYYEGTSGTCESEPAISATNPANDYVVVTVTSVGGAENNARVYPNPTNGNVTIEAVGMKQITVVSALGQVVYDRQVNNDSEMLNMAEYKAGIYMVRIATENGVSVQRVTVVR